MHVLLQKVNRKYRDCYQKQYQNRSIEKKYQLKLFLRIVYLLCVRLNIIYSIVCLSVYCGKDIFDDLGIVVIDYECKRVYHHRLIYFTFQYNPPYQQKHKPNHQWTQNDDDVFDHIDWNTFDSKTNDQTFHRIHRLFGWFSYSSQKRLKYF